MKTYVEVNVTFREDGMMLPRSILWEDGVRYKIDRVLDIKPFYSRAGGCGDRYTIKVNGKESHIFFEQSSENKSAYLGRWFVERKEA